MTKEELQAKLTAIANATRSKASSTSQMTLDQIASTINSLKTGGHNMVTFVQVLIITTTQGLLLFRNRCLVII